MPTYSTYKVQPGDSLWKIAQQHNTTVQKLLELNPHLNTAQRKYGNLIYSGETIKLPSSPSQTKAQETISKTQTKSQTQITSHQDSASKSVNTSKYTVVKGDTLSKIAKTHGTTVEELLKANPHLNTPARKYGDLIYAGETLNLPSPPPVTKVEEKISISQDKVQSSKDKLTQEIDKQQSDTTKNLISVPITLPYDMTASQIEAVYGVTHEQFQQAMQQSFSPDTLFKKGQKIYLPVVSKATEHQDKAASQTRRPAIILDEPLSLMDIASKYGIPYTKLLELNPHIKDPHKKLEPGELVFIGEITEDVFKQLKTYFDELKLVPTVIQQITGVIEVGLKPVSQAIQQLIDLHKLKIERGYESAEKAIKELKEAFEKWGVATERLINQISLEFYKKEAENWRKIEEQMAKTQEIIAEIILPGLGAALSWVGLAVPGLAGIFAYFLGNLLAMFGPTYEMLTASSKELSELPFTEELEAEGVAKGQLPEVEEIGTLF